MKKIIGLMLAVLLLIPGISFAEALDVSDALSKVEFKQGVAYSVQDSVWNYLSTAEILKKGDFSLDAGTAYDAEKTGVKAVIVGSYRLGGLEKLGVEVPILKYIDLKPGVYFGVGRIGAGNETDYGLSLSVLSVNF